MSTNLLSIRNLCGALALSLLPVLGVASPVTVSWDLTSANNNVVFSGPSNTTATFTGTGDEKLTVEAFSLKQPKYQSPSWSPANIGQWWGGLGVISGRRDAHYLDNFRRYELLRFDLRELSHGDNGTFTLTYGSPSDDYMIWGNNTGLVPDFELNLNAGDEVLGSGQLNAFSNTVVFSGDEVFDYLFIGGDLEIFKGCGYCESDSFKVANLTISPEVSPGPGPVPLPAAFPLFTAALGLFGFLGMRRASKGVVMAA